MIIFIIENYHWNSIPPGLKAKYSLYPGYNRGYWILQPSGLGPPMLFSPIQPLLIPCPFCMEFKDVHKREGSRIGENFKNKNEFTQRNAFCPDLSGKVQRKKRRIT
jgi:hypothetical protein